MSCGADPFAIKPVSCFEMGKLERNLIMGEPILDDVHNYYPEHMEEFIKLIVEFYPSCRATNCCNTKLRLKSCLIEQALPLASSPRAA